MWLSGTCNKRKQTLGARPHIALPVEETGMKEGGGGLTSEGNSASINDGAIQPASTTVQFSLFQRRCNSASITSMEVFFTRFLFRTEELGESVFSLF
jgi:hypothetical protein